MQLGKYLLILVMLIASQAVFATQPEYGTEKQNDYARNLKPPKGKALVYIYERKRDGAGPSPTIWLNNYKIGRLVPGAFTVWQLAPGQLGVRVDGVEPGSLSVISKAGQVYLFRVSVSQTPAGPKAQLESLPESYRGDLAEMRYLKNPRQIETAAITPTQPKASAGSSAKPKPSRTSRRVVYGWQPGDVGVQVKLGSLSLSNQSQTILVSGTSHDLNFDKSVSSPLGLEVYYQLNDGLVVGGEVLSYKSNFTGTGLSGAGDVSTLVLLGNVKQYYRTQDNLQPYLGAGLGIATANISGAISGKTTGFAYQFVAGLEYRFDKFGLFAEAKYIGAITKDSNDQQIDMTSSGALAGVTVHF